MAIRTTEYSIASHRRLVYRNVVEAMRRVFDADYNRDYQFKNLRISPTFPLERIDYPCVVVQYNNNVVLNAGIGHVEHFPDPYGNMRKWHHSRFEGSISFQVFALSPLDRDILVDAVTEVIRFGTLDSQLKRFYELIYPDIPIPPPPTNPDAPWLLYDVAILSQLALNSDILSNIGDSASPAPWGAEDALVYSGGISTELHGAYYNTYTNTPIYSRVRRVIIDAYLTGQYGQELPFPGHAEIAWYPPFIWQDSTIVSAQASPSGVESYRAWRGFWNSTTQYFVDDVVFHQTNYYRALIDNIDDQPPSSAWAIWP